MPWNKTYPPKRIQKSVKIRYQDSSGHVYTGEFVWSDRERTFIEVCEGLDGVGLYKEDGWKILGWKEPMEQQRSCRRKRGTVS